jgi:hypothetical protein
VWCVLVYFPAENIHRCFLLCLKIFFTYHSDGYQKRIQDDVTFLTNSSAVDMSQRVFSVTLLYTYASREVLFIIDPKHNSGLQINHR